MKSLDIQVGPGRVPWADATTLRDAVYLPAGWALPGGLRTDDRERALVVAENIAALIGGRTAAMASKEWSALERIGTK